MGKKLKIIFAGTPEFAAQHLQVLLATNKYDIIAVYSMPDKPAGRGKKLLPTAVKQLALQYQIPVYQPTTFNDPISQQQLRELNSDLMVVVAYGMILPDVILTTPKYGCINVHASLLPRWRGAAPIQRAIWAGDQQTGVTIMQIDTGLDSGDILYQLSCLIETDETSTSLYLKLSTLGQQALIYTLENLAALKPRVQDESLVCYAKKLSKAEAKLDWSLSAVELERYIRAFIPFPIAFLQCTDDKQQLQIVKIWQAQVIQAKITSPAGTIVKIDKRGIQIATAKDILQVTMLQPAGKKPMAIQDFLNGRKAWLQEGDLLV